MAEQLDITDCTGKYSLMEKVANIPLYDHKFSGRIFLCQFPWNFPDYNNILITMKKDAAQP